MRSSDLVVVFVEFEFLEDVCVLVSVEFAHLTSPSAIVEVSGTKFEATAPPSGNIVEDFPSFAKSGSFEATVDADVFGSSCSDETDIVDGKTETVRQSITVELNFVHTFVDVDPFGDGVDSVVTGGDVLDKFSIPEEFSLAGSEGFALSAGVLEGDFEFSGESGRRSGSGRRGRRAGDDGRRVVVGVAGS